MFLKYRNWGKFIPRKIKSRIIIFHNMSYFFIAQDIIGFRLCNIHLNLRAGRFRNCLIFIIKVPYQRSGSCSSFSFRNLTMIWNIIRILNQMFCSISPVFNQEFYLSGTCFSFIFDLAIMKNGCLSIFSCGHF